ASARPQEVAGRVTAETRPRLVLSGVRRAFGASQALSGVDLRASPGEGHALVGENGAGKSTLLSILPGVVQPEAGTLQVDGHPYPPANPVEARQAGVATVHQELSLCPHLTVAENVMLGKEPTRAGILQRSAMRDRALEALSRLSASGEEPVPPETRVADLP